MTLSRIFLTFILFASLSASACAPALTSSPVPMDASATPVQVTAASEATVTSMPEATLAPTQAALPVATSRGPGLHATDPATVKLASGQLQLVEFFRFT